MCGGCCNALPASEMGQKRTCAVHSLMSVKGHKRTFAVQNGAATSDVRLVPIADIAPLFDHLVGASMKHRWNVNPQRLGSL